MKKKNIKEQTVAKGYRLKKSTHKLIESIQKITNESKENVIFRAMSVYKEKITSGSR